MEKNRLTELKGPGGYRQTQAEPAGQGEVWGDHMSGIKTFSKHLGLTGPTAHVREVLRAAEHHKHFIFSSWYKSCCA